VKPDVGRRAATSVTLAVFLATLGCSAAGPAEPAQPAEAAGKTAAPPTITLGDGTVDFDGRTIALPTSSARLAELFGPWTLRSGSFGDVCVWTEPGLAAWADPETGEVRRLELCCVRDGAAPPKSAAPPVHGRVALAGGFLDASSTPADLTALGLVTPSDGFGAGQTWGGRLGHLVIMATPSHGALTLSLQWTETLLHPPRGAGAAPLFTVRAREHGCDFDEDLVELSRAGNVSTVRLDIYGEPSQGSVGRSMFDCGAIGALAIERGFRFAVQLGSADRQSEAPAGGGSSWQLIGFTNDPKPDIAREFPEHFEADRHYEVLSADWAMTILGDWPELASARR
jgi:hypothetical protein